MRSFHFFCTRNSGELFAVDPKTLYTCKLSTGANGRPAPLRTTLEGLGLPGGLFKCRRAAPWELEPLRFALVLDLKERVRAIGYQPAAYVSLYLAREVIDLEKELNLERVKNARKQKAKRARARLKPKRKTAAEYRQDKEKHAARLAIQRAENPTNIDSEE